MYYIPELWRVTSVVSPGVYRVEGCLSKTRKVAQLSALAPANICSRASRAAQLEGEVRQMKEKLLQAESECRSMNDKFQTARSQYNELQETITQLYKDVEKWKRTARQERTNKQITERLMKEVRSKFILERPCTLYELLYLRDSATSKEISVRFKKLALLTHPDQGGNEEYFKILNTAQGILMDDESRQVYDEQGFAAAQELNQEKMNNL